MDKKVLAAIIVRAAAGRVRMPAERVGIVTSDWLRVNVIAFRAYSVTSALSSFDGAAVARLTRTKKGTPTISATS